MVRALKVRTSSFSVHGISEILTRATQCVTREVVVLNTKDES